MLLPQVSGDRLRPVEKRRVGSSLRLDCRSGQGTNRGVCAGAHPRAYPVGPISTPYSLSDTLQSGMGNLSTGEYLPRCCCACHNAGSTTESRGAELLCRPTSRTKTMNMSRAARPGRGQITLTAGSGGGEVLQGPPGLNCPFNELSYNLSVHGSRARKHCNASSWPKNAARVPLSIRIPLILHRLRANIQPSTLRRRVKRSPSPHGQPMPPAECAGPA